MEINNYLASVLSMITTYISGVMVFLAIEAVCYIIFFVKDTQTTRKLCFAAMCVQLCMYIFAFAIMNTIGGKL